MIRAPRHAHGDHSPEPRRSQLNHLKKGGKKIRAGTGQTPSGEVNVTTRQSVSTEELPAKPQRQLKTVPLLSLLVTQKSVNLLAQRSFSHRTLRSGVLPLPLTRWLRDVDSGVR